MFQNRAKKRRILAKPENLLIVKHFLPNYYNKLGHKLLQKKCYKLYKFSSFENLKAFLKGRFFSLFPNACRRFSSQCEFWSVKKRCNCNYYTYFSRRPLWVLSSFSRAMLRAILKKEMLELISWHYKAGKEVNSERNSHAIRKDSRKNMLPGP